ncbi:sporulation delaying protein family toxin [Alkalihalophilus marmarensis]|uniref:sporulation delaying protein family toxin n=1 Tax=Alkalihalophilus marmarensis TaxID=521377 RepID=UPI002DBB5665|nr:sporulation delaying protein family toxin [Alkalihalophilus marmarensis]MEC2071431.1 sporulation delaying protein family toxin [Alkalihalophilus marmarensis]
MKLINKKDFLMKKSFIMITSFLLIISTFGFSGSSSNAEQLSKNFSGEELFRGITIGQGEVGQFFVNDWTTEEYKINNSEEQIKFVDEVLKVMHEMDSNYFNDLKEAVEAGDYVKTKDLLILGGDLFSNAASYDIKIQEVEPNAALFAGVYAVAGVTTAVAASHAVWLTFYIWQYGAGPGISSDGSELSTDMAVYKLIKEVNE